MISAVKLIKAILLLSAIQFVYGYPTNDTKITYAKQFDAPWTVLLLIQEERCTGTLIRDKYVLTAASCFDRLKDSDYNLRQVKIYLGEWKTETDPDCGFSDEDIEDSCNLITIMLSRRLKIHEKYLLNERNKLSYDIAIVELVWTPRPSKMIQNIALPDEDTCEDELKDSMSVTGFGEIKPMQYTSIKKKVNMTLFETKTCKRMLGTFFNPDLHFCGGGSTGITTCIGDSGSPAVNKIDNIDTLQGIALYGTAQCGYGNMPSGFLKIACFMDWIESKINEFTHGTTRRSTRETTVKFKTTTYVNNLLDDDDDNFFD